jgi:hypothetical protein
MAVTFVAASATVTGANPTVAVPAGYAQGDLLVIVTTGTATPTTPAGWTQRSAQGATGFITLLYKFAGGTEASVAVTLAGTTSKAVMLAYRGASAIDTVSGFTTATAATSVATGLTGNAFANELEVSIFVGNNVAGTWTAPALTTSRVNSAPTTAVNGMLIVDETQAAAGNSTSRTGTITAAHTLSAVAFSIIPSGRYWVGGTGTWTTTTTNWAFTSGGASGAPAPTAQDPVFFDQATTYTVTLTGALTCFDMTVSAGTVTFTSTGTITNSGSISLIAGTTWSATGLLTFSSTSSGRTVTTNGITINSPITFNGVGGVWSLGSALTTGLTLTTTLTSGSLILNGFNLTTGTFSSNNSNTRTITFGTNNIVLLHLTAGQTVLDMAVVTGLTLTGTGGFSSFNTVTGTYVFGTTGGTSSNSPNLTIVGSDTAVQTFTTGSWFNKLSFGTTAFDPGTTSLNLNSLTLSSGGTFTGLTATMVGSGTITSNTNTTLATLTINGTGITTTLGDTFSLSATSTVTLTAGTLALNGFNLTTGIFSSSNTNTRAIQFGTNNIVLAHTTAAQTVLNMATATGYTNTGTAKFITDASVTRTLTYASTAGTDQYSPSLYVTSGSSTITLTTNSRWALLDFTGSSATVTGTVFLAIDLVLSATGTYTGLNITETLGGQWYPNGKTLGAVTLNNAIGTIAHVQYTNGDLRCSSFTITSGIWDFSSQPNSITTPFNLICSGAISINFTNGSLIDFYGNPPPSITCATWTHTGTFTLSSLYNITATTSFTANSGLGLTFTYASGGTLTTLDFIQTTGNVTLNQALALSGSYTLTAGTLTLAGNLTTTAFITTGTGTRAIAFSTNQIILTGNNATIWDGGGANISFTGTVTIVSDYAGSVGTRTINVGTGWTEATAFDVKAGSAVGISIGTSGTDTVAIAGNLDTLDLTGMNFTYSQGVMTAYVDYIIPSTGGTIASSANTLTLASTNVTPRNITSNSRTLDFPITISGVGGTFQLTNALVQGLTRTFTLTSGTLNLNGFDLTTGIFSSQNTNNRTITFGSNFIYLVHTTAAQTVLNLGYTNFIWTGTGGFSSAMTVTRTFTATTTPTVTSAIKLYITSGSAAATFTAGCWFELLDFTGYSGTASGTINIKNMTLSSGGTYTGIVMTTYGTGSLNGNGNTTGIGAFALGQALITPTVTSLSGNFSCTTLSTPVNTATLDLAGYILTCSGSVVYNRGTLTMSAGTINCTTFQADKDFTFDSGTINASVSIVVNAGFTYSAPATLGPTPTFTQGGGDNVVFNKSYALTTTGTYNILSTNTVSLTLNDVTLSTGGFVITDRNKTINFGTSGQLLLTGNNMTVWSNSNTVTTTGTVSVSSTYTGSVGTRSFLFAGADFDINIGTGTGVTMFLAPGATDTIFLDGLVKSVDLTGMTFTFSYNVTNNFIICGSLTIPATGGTISSNNSPLFISTPSPPTPSTLSIGRTVDFPINIGSTSGVTLNSNITIGSTRLFTFSAGTLNLNDYTFSAGKFIGTANSSKTLNFGTSGQITVTGVDTVWDTSTLTFFTVSGTPVVNVTNSGSTAITVRPGAATEEQSISFNFTAGTYALAFLVTAGYAARNVNFTGFAGTLGATAACTIYGNLTLSTGMSLTGTVDAYTFGATSGTKTITSNGKIINAITINGLGGTFSLTDPVSITSAFTVNAGTFNTNNQNLSCTQFSSWSTSTTRAINLGSSTCTVNGIFRVSTTGLTFDGGTSTINYTGFNDLVVDNGTTTGITLYNFIYNVTGSISKTMTGKNTFNNLTLFTNTSAGTNGGYVITDDIVVNGTFTIPVGTGTIGGRFSLISATTGTQVMITANAVSLNRVNFRDINAQGTIPWTGTSLGNVGNNSNITFDVGVNKYWSLAAGGNWNSTAWALTSGGTPADANYPLPQDTCVIQNTGLNTSATITMNIDFVVTTIDMSTRTNAMNLNIGTSTNVYFLGDWINGSGLTSVGGTAGTINFVNNVSGTQNITSAGKLFSPDIFVNTNGTVKLLDNLNQDSTVGLQPFTLTAGTLDLNNFTLSTAIFSSNNSNTRAINFGTGNINLTHTTAATVVLSMATLTGFTYTGSGGFTVATMTNTRTFTCGTIGGTSSNAPNLTFTTGASIATITTAGWFNKLDYGTTTFTQAASTLNVNSITLSATGTYTALILNLVGSGTLTYNGKTTAAVTLLAGTPTFSGTVACTTFTVNGPTFNFTSGTLNPTTSFVLTSGGFTLNGGTLGATPTFTHTAGTVTFNSSYALTVTGTYTLTAGTLTLADGVTLTTGIFSSTNANTRSIAFGSTSAGNINLTHTTAATVVLSMAIVTGFSYTGPGGFTVADMANTRTLTFGTTGGSTTNAPNLTFTTGASVATLTNNSWFKNLTFGTTAFNPGTTALNMAGNLTLSSGGVYTTTTVNALATGAYTFNGASLGPLVINASGGTITFAGAGACTTLAMTLGTLDFALYNLTCSAAVTYTGGTFSNFGTLACTTFTINGPNFSFSSGTINPSTSFVLTTGSFTYGGTATLGATPLFTQTAGTATFNKNYALTVTGTYTLTAGTLTLADGVTLSTGIFSSTNANTRSIQFGSASAGNINLTHTTAATVVLSMATLTGFTYTGSGGFVVANMTNTRTLTCGTTGGTITNAPNVTFTTGSSVATLTTGSWFNNLDFGTTFFTLATTSLNIAGNLTLSAVVGSAYTGLTAIMLDTATTTLTTNGRTIAALTINGTGGAFTFADAVTATGALTLTSGTIYTNNNITSGSFASTGTATRGIVAPNITYTVSGAGATAFSNASGTGLTMSGIVISMTNAAAKTFAGGGGTYPVLNNGGAGALTISGSNSFDTISNSVQPTTFTFTSLTTQTVNNFDVRGIAGSLVTINSSTAASAATLTKSSGIVYGSYLSIRDSNATGGATWYAGPTSTSVSNNTGWIFTQLPIITMGNLTVADGGFVISNDPVVFA